MLSRGPVSDLFGTSQLDLARLGVRDGRQLHNSVPRDRWCVSRWDLVHFRRLVLQHVANGQIVPTEWDAFDPADSEFGPCVHTVCQQMIKPITDQAGEMSWALMLHPEGLECELFVTHCWQEGIYEFLDKVIHSWPNKILDGGAYCCMLSNPQSLDIGGLIDSPRDSPFAHALRASSCVLVVPNRTCSIYTRVWCAYEAFLAYSEDKLIVVAVAPPPVLWRRLTCMAAAMAAVFALWTYVIFVHLGRPVPVTGSDTMRARVALVLTILCFSPTAFLRPRLTNRVPLYTGSVLSAVLASEYCTEAAVVLYNFGLTGANQSVPHTGFHFLTQSLIGLTFCVASMASEADLLWGLRAEREAEELRAGYTGRLHDAQSSVATDKEKIIGELVASGVEDEVDNAIDILLTAGMSSPTLARAFFHAGKLPQAGYWNLATVMVVWMNAWASPALDSLAFQLDLLWCSGRGLADRGVEAECDSTPLLERGEVWLSLLGVLEALLWLLTFKLQGTDKRGFTGRSTARIMFFGALFCWVIPLLLWDCWVFTNVVGSAVFYLLLAPVVLALAIAGPGCTAAVPFLGPRLVKLLMAPVVPAATCFSSQKSDANAKANAGGLARPTSLTMCSQERALHLEL